MKWMKIRPMWKCCECHTTTHAPDYTIEDTYVPPGWKKVWRGFRGWDWVCPSCPPYPRRKR